MIRNLLVLMVFLGVGFGASVAQSDIFVRQSPKEEVSKDADKAKKPSLFLRPFNAFRKKKTGAGADRYSSKLDTSGVRGKIIQDMKLLAYWQQSGKRPKGAKQLRDYATALRSPNMALMFAARQKELPKLLSLHNKRMASVAKMFDGQVKDVSAIEAIDAMIMADLGRVSRVARAAKTVRAVYQNFDPKKEDAVSAGSSASSGSASALSNASAARVPAPREGTRRSVRPSVTPIYVPRKKSADDDGQKNSSGVYKNYR